MAAVGEVELDCMPAGTVFHTVPWIPGLENQPGGQFSRKHMQLLYVVEWGLKNAPEACGVRDIARALRLSIDMVTSSAVLLMELGRIDHLSIRADELGLFECELDTELVRGKRK